MWISEDPSGGFHGRRVGNRQADRHRPEKLHRLAAIGGRDPADERHEDEQDIERRMRDLRGEALPVGHRLEGRRTAHAPHAKPDEGEGEYGEAERLVQLVEIVGERPLAEVRHGDRDRDLRDDQRRHRPMQRFLRARIAARRFRHRKLRLVYPLRISVPAPWSVNSSKSTECATLPSRITTASTPFSRA